MRELRRDQRLQLENARGKTDRESEATAPARPES
jgi:hypothetical protein